MTAIFHSDCTNVIDLIRWVRKILAAMGVDSNLKDVKNTVYACIVKRAFEDGQYHMDDLVAASVAEHLRRYDWLKVVDE